MKKAVFITFEGPEKSGKSTQAELLSRFLKSKGYKVVFLREPGSTEIGERIRQILLDKKYHKMSAMTEMLLYMAARAQIVDESIRPALKEGCVVLCDRYLDSTLAYQGYGCGMDKGSISSVGKLATGGLLPDLTLLLDFWACSENLKNEKTRDRIEMRPDVFHERVKKGYFSLAKKFPKRIKIVKVEDKIEATQERIREIVLKCLLKK
ncbi:MAG TPA: dTMP kinase [Candidatus Omnitrophota bacterium]|nr:dTMP kinase [Candidatus Omnitrophota bacterium]